VIEYLTDRIAIVLEQHLDLVEGLKTKLEEALRPSKETLSTTLESLRSIRSRLKEDLENILNRMSRAEMDNLKDLYALISFYIEVAYPGEKSALEAAAAFIDVSPDLVDLDEVYNRAVSVREAIEEAIQGMGSTWPK
jgi:hypothetical protein